MGGVSRQVQFHKSLQGPPFNQHRPQLGRGTLLQYPGTHVRQHQQGDWIGTQPGSGVYSNQVHGYGGSSEDQGQATEGRCGSQQDLQIVSRGTGLRPRLRLHVSAHRV